MVPNILLNCERGDALLADGKLVEATASYLEALALQPDSVEILSKLAVVMGKRGQIEVAIRICRRILSLKPDDVKTWLHLGSLYCQSGSLEAAASAFEDALWLRPDHVPACANLAVVLEHLERYDEAIEHLHRATRLERANVQAWINLSNVLRKAWKPEEAEVAARQALRLADGARSAEAHNALGAALLELGRADEALATFRQAMVLAPGHAEARVNLAMTMLLRGDWPAGFRALECRFDHPVSRRTLPGRRWGIEAESGVAEALPAGSRVLLYAEGGLGNAIQFARYATQVARMGAEVGIECRPELVPLLRSVAGVSRVVGFGEPAFDVEPGAGGRGAGYDRYAALMSLPALFGTDVTNVPAEVPYVSVSAERVQRWAGVLRQCVGLTDGKHPANLLIGVSWQGDQTPLFRRNRSFPVHHLAALARIPGVRLVSLQKGCTFDGSFPLVELPGLDDSGDGAFLDTAAVMRHLDLVVTCDTSIAHLAGAMGMSVWVALPFAADWRWMAARVDTPWYPTMRLFRQTSRGEWKGVMDQMAGELRHSKGVRQEP